MKRCEGVKPILKNIPSIKIKYKKKYKKKLSLYKIFKLNLFKIFINNHSDEPDNNNILNTLINNIIELKKLIQY